MFILTFGGVRGDSNSKVSNFYKTSKRAIYSPNGIYGDIAATRSV